MPDPTRFRRNSWTQVHDIGLGHVVIEADKHDPSTQQILEQHIHIRDGKIGAVPRVPAVRVAVPRWISWPGSQASRWSNGSAAGPERRSRHGQASTSRSTAVTDADDDRQPRATRATRARRRIIDYARSRTVHLGSSLSVVDVLDAIYRRIEARGETTSPSPLVLSKGHAVWALYALLAEQGCRRYDDVAGLPGPSVRRLSGHRRGDGALGHGLSVAAGMAEGFRLSGTERAVYVILGDGSRPRARSGRPSPSQPTAASTASSSSSTSTASSRRGRQTTSCA